MAAATVDVVSAVINERQGDVPYESQLEYRTAIKVLKELSQDIKTGKVSAKRVEALTWVAAPVKTSLDAKG